MSVRELMTADAKEFLANDEGTLERVRLNGSDYVFSGDFYHEGVSLNAGEVLDIMAHQVMQDAVLYVSNVLMGKRTPLKRALIEGLAGIQFIGPVEGKWWEKRGTKQSSPLEQPRRYHKFGGEGEAYLLTFAYEDSEE